MDDSKRTMCGETKEENRRTQEMARVKQEKQTLKKTFKGKHSDLNK